LPFLPFLYFVLSFSLIPFIFSTFLSIHVFVLSILSFTFLTFFPCYAFLFSTVLSLRLFPSFPLFASFSFSFTSFSPSLFHLPLL
jgi:hypothetical protein